VKRFLLTSGALLLTAIVLSLLIPQPRHMSAQTNVTIPQNFANVLCADVSGSNSAQSCSTTPSFTAGSGTAVLYKTTTANAGDLTIAVNGGSAQHARKWLGASVLASGDISANTPMWIVNDGTYWELSTIGNAPGGSSAIALKTYEGTWNANTAAQPAQNTTLVWGIYNNQPITTSTITYQVNVADNTANLYDIGVYNSSGTLLVHTGATAGTTFAPNTSALSLTWTGGAVTIPAGKIYVAYTTNCSSACAKFFAGTAFSFVNANSPTGGGTSGGALNSSITVPSDTYGGTSTPAAIIR
jgi:hypothetical protein